MECADDIRQGSEKGPAQRCTSGHEGPALSAPGGSQAGRPAISCQAPRATCEPLIRGSPAAAEEAPALEGLVAPEERI